MVLIFFLNIKISYRTMPYSFTKGTSQFISFKNTLFNTTTVYEPYGHQTGH